MGGDKLNRDRLGEAKRNAIPPPPFDDSQVGISGREGDTIYFVRADQTIKK